MELQDTIEKLQNAINELPDIEEFQAALLQLRSGDYYDGIERIKKYLELDEYSHAAIEALLIYEIKRFEFKKPIKVDAALMEIGLLRDFSISEEVRGSEIAAFSKTDVTKRRENFLLASTYVKYYHPGGCHSHKDLESRTRLKKAATSLGATNGTDLISVAKKIWSIDNEKISEHIMLSIKEWPSPESGYIPEKFLPELQHPREDHPIEPEKPKPGTVCSYIETIQVSDKYDDVGVELYQKLCRTKDNPPYDEWVATWLIKCIRKSFGKTLMADILHASFALLFGYELMNTSVEERLNRYLEESRYLSICSFGRYYSVEDVEDENKMKEIENGLKELEQELLKQLITYIKQVPDPVEYISKLNKYGELKEFNGRKIYSPNKQRLYNRIDEKHKQCPRYDKIILVLLRILLKNSDNNTENLSRRAKVNDLSKLLLAITLCMLPLFFICFRTQTIKKYTQEKLDSGLNAPVYDGDYRSDVENNAPAPLVVSGKLNKGHLSLHDLRD